MNDKLFENVHDLLLGCDNTDEASKQSNTDERQHMNCIPTQTNSANNMRNAFTAAAAAAAILLQFST